MPTTIIPTSPLNRIATLQATFKAAALPEELYDGIEQVWVKDPEDAFRIIGSLRAARLKAAEPPPQTNPTDALALQLAAILRAQMGDRKVDEWFQEQIRTAAKAAQKATTKAAPLTPIQQMARATIPELYSTKGRK